MNAVLDFIVWLLVLVVAVWIGIFGAAGALVARMRDGSALIGFLWGALLGPIGVVIAYFFSGSAPHRDGGHDGGTSVGLTGDSPDDYF